MARTYRRTGLEDGALERDARRLAAEDRTIWQAWVLLRQGNFPHLGLRTLVKLARRVGIEFAVWQRPGRNALNFPELPSKLRELAAELGEVSRMEVYGRLVLDGYPGLSWEGLKKYEERAGVKFGDWRKTSRDGGQSCSTCKYGKNGICRLCYCWGLTLPCEKATKVYNAAGELIWDEPKVWLRLYGKEPDEFVDTRPDYWRQELADN